MPVKSFLVAHMSEYKVNVDFGYQFEDKFFQLLGTPTFAFETILCAITTLVTQSNLTNSAMGDEMFCW